MVVLFSYISNVACYDSLQPRHVCLRTAWFVYNRKYFTFDYQGKQGMFVTINNAYACLFRDKLNYIRKRIIGENT